MPSVEFLKALLRPLRALWRGKQLERDIHDEIGFHIDTITSTNIKSGMSPEKARQAALRRFGGDAYIKEQMREARGLVFFEALSQDLRFGFRMLCKNPGFSIIALLTVALGIGINSAIFSVVNSVLIHPFPFKDQNRLIVAWKNDQAANNPLLELSYAEFLDWRDQNHVFDQVATMPTTAYGYGFTLLGEGEPDQIESTRVSANFFDVLGANPEIGRTFIPEEDNPGSERIVVISHALWQQRFGGKREIIGKVLNLSGRGFTVIGVMPPEFDFPHGVDIWTPLASASGNKALLTNRNAIFLQMIGRLKPGATVEQARSELDTIARRISLQQHPSDSPEGAVVTPLVEHILGNTRPALYLLSGAAILVLLIVCVNVANLLLARATVRHKEIAVRSALGAGRIRLIRQLLTESLLLAMGGGVIGIVLAYLAIRVLRAIGPADIPRLSDIKLNGSVFGVALGIAVVTSIIFGLMPALAASKVDLSEAIKESGGKIAGEQKGRVLRSALVVAEVALTLVLLIGAGLLIQSFRNLQHASLGYNPDYLLTMQINLNSPRYPDWHKRGDFYRELISKVESIPGVMSAAVMTLRPLEGSVGWYLPFQVEGQSPDEAKNNPYPNLEVVTPDYFKAMGIPLSGRSFVEQDTQEAPTVAIISENMAKRFWPGQDPIGKRIRPVGDDNWFTIVGVAKEARYMEMNNVRLDIYLASTQSSAPTRYLVVRTGSDPLAFVSAIRNEVSMMDKDQPIVSIKPMNQIVSESLAKPRFNMLLLGLFAALAMILASVGIYGVITYSVSQRTHEIGVRMALGAQRGDVMKMVVKHGMIMTLAGIVIGLIGAAALTRLMEALLYGVKATDPVIFAAISLLLVVISLIACCVPARRATSVDPTVALRYE